MSYTTSIRVSLPLNHDGCRGKECPKCEQYFKVMPGTGLTGTTEVSCPYVVEYK